MTAFSYHCTLSIESGGLLVLASADLSERYCKHPKGIPPATDFSTLVTDGEQALILYSM